jgi:hypothetical protein
MDQLLKGGFSEALVTKQLLFRQHNSSFLPLVTSRVRFLPPEHPPPPGALRGSLLVVGLWTAAGLRHVHLRRFSGLLSTLDGRLRHYPPRLLGGL